VLCSYFGADAVVIVGSQAILATWPDAPPLLRRSGEIDAYPENARRWEASNPEKSPASEEIAGLFGEGSDFHRSHLFYIDGVDDTTATLPADWRTRQRRIPVDCYGRTVHAIAPEIHDLLISKLARLAAKDREFIIGVNAHHRVDKKILIERMNALTVADPIKARAIAFAKTLED